MPCSSGIGLVRLIQTHSVDQRPALMRQAIPFDGLHVFGSKADDAANPDPRKTASPDKFANRPGGNPPAFGDLIRQEKRHRGLRSGLATYVAFDPERGELEGGA
jgi:hypothetical protein